MNFIKRGLNKPHKSKWTFNTKVDVQVQVLRLVDENPKEAKRGNKT